MTVRSAYKTLPNQRAGISDVRGSELLTSVQNLGENSKDWKHVNGLFSEILAVRVY